MPAVFATAVVGAAVVLLTAVLLAGCSGGSIVPAGPGLRLAPGTTYSADLDRDGEFEYFFIDGSSASLTIRDSRVAYHSREKWQVVEASVGDTDRDGIPEIVTLLDGDGGRHIALFADYGGDFRERFVSSALNPRPLSFEVVAAQPAGDLLWVSEAPAGTPTLYRWNGFGFTRVR